MAPVSHINPAILTRLMYISRSKLVDADLEPSLHAISAAATARNATMNVTGALLHTGTHFAQVLEGAAGDLNILMGMIRADRRHDELRIVELRPVEERHFAAWMTVYNGRASYIQRILDTAGAAPHSQAEQRKLLQLFREFARDHMRIVPEASRFG